MFVCFKSSSRSVTSEFVTLLERELDQWALQERGAGERTQEESPGGRRGAIFSRAAAEQTSTQVALALLAPSMWKASYGLQPSLLERRRGNPLDWRCEIAMRSDQLVRLINAGAFSVPFEDAQALPVDESYFSHILKARCARTKVPVILKILKHELSEYNIKAFKREASLLERLQGRANVVQLIRPLGTLRGKVTAPGDVEIDIEYLYFGLQVYPQTVLDYLRSCTGSFSHTLALFRGLVAGMNQLHQRMICHRDLKPSNCFANGDDGIVGDLGCARSTDDIDSIGGDEYSWKWFGDRRYIAPECLLGWDCLNDFFRSDFYGLGCILFEMATGKILFDSVPELASKVWDIRDSVLNSPSKKQAKRAKQAFLDLDASCVLPSIGVQKPLPGPSSRGAIQGIFSRLCAFDPTKRLSDFDGLFRLVDRAAQIVREEEDRSAT